jgi:hypothetical protein
VDRFLSALIIANDFGIEAANQTDPNETVTLFGQEVKQRTVFDIVLDFNPIKGLQEALDGRNYVTNEKLGPFSRAVSGVTSLLSFVPGEGRAVGQVMKQGIKQAGKYTLEPAVKGGFKQADRLLNGKLAKIVDEGRERIARFVCGKFVHRATPPYASVFLMIGKGKDGCVDQVVEGLGGRSRIGPSLDDLSKAAAVPDKGGFTRAGRSLTKHGAGARKGNKLFPPARGNPAEINRLAQDIVDDILTNPETKVIKSYRGRFVETIEYIAPDGRGIVFDANGNFRFFREGGL